MKSVSRARASSRSARVAAIVAVATFAIACKRDAPSSSSSSSPAAPASAAAAAQASAPSSPLVLAPANAVRWIDAPPGTTDVAAAVRDALARAREDHRTLIVYVGATWCEPCQRFHHAVERGELDAAFPSLTVLAFDADRDSEPLATAGYVSRLIPLFVLPRADGSASDRHIEGSVKGEQAASEITPRLRALIEQAR